MNSSENSIKSHELWKSDSYTIAFSSASLQQMVSVSFQSQCSRQRSLPHICQHVQHLLKNTNIQAESTLNMTDFTPPLTERVLVSVIWYFMPWTEVISAKGQDFLSWSTESREDEQDCDEQESISHRPGCRGSAENRSRVWWGGEGERGMIFPLSLSHYILNNHLPISRPDSHHVPDYLRVHKHTHKHTHTHCMSHSFRYKTCFQKKRNEWQEIHLQ